MHGSLGSVMLFAVVASPVVIGLGLLVFPERTLILQDELGASPVTSQEDDRTPVDDVEDAPEPRPLSERPGLEDRDDAREPGPDAERMWRLRGAYFVAVGVLALYVTYGV